MVGFTALLSSSLFISIQFLIVDGFRAPRFVVTMKPKVSTTSTHMSDDRSLLDEMRKSLGERDDSITNARDVAFADAEKDSKQLLQGLRDLERDPNIKANNKFVEWLADNGVWVKTQSTWGRAQHPLVISSNTEDDGESCGRGLLARDSMAEGELMMTIPLDLCLTRAVSQETLGKVRYFCDCP